jgi:hypothetical protein
MNGWVIPLHYCPCCFDRQGNVTDICHSLSKKKNDESKTNHQVEYGVIRTATVSLKLSEALRLIVLLSPNLHLKKYLSAKAKICKYSSCPPFPCNVRTSRPLTHIIRYSGNICSTTPGIMETVTKSTNTNKDQHIYCVFVY